MLRLVLGSGLLRRGSAILLVQSRYANEPLPLWTLPGGRQEPGETIAQTVEREFLEETSLRVRPGDLAYVSESIDREADLHVLNCTFWVSETDPNVGPQSNDPKVADVRFVPVVQAPKLLAADVLRIPVAAALSADLETGYFCFDARDVAVPFFGRQ